ncbi:endonuclease VII [Pseudomonas phage vB_PpuM-KoPa-4]|uniref:Endonuclease VII n=1 Tax=Pseudomonas phage vB_PpuM-KoPa-4 TaxID=3132618 RepID=A0AAX4MYR9_9CAUD
MLKVCKGCGAEKPFDQFHKHPETYDGRTGKCKACKYARQKELAEQNGRQAQSKYRKTYRGYLAVTYSNMKGRVNGRVKKSRHLYEGLQICTKEEFYAWGDTPEFRAMLDYYKQTGYDQRFAPSVDRIDTARGYEIDNMRWLQQRVNSSLGGQNK